MKARTSSLFTFFQRFVFELGAKSVFGHCIHLEDAEVAALAAKRGIAAFCPTSNLFLGSGLFDMRRLDEAGVRVALATDVDSRQRITQRSHVASGDSGQFVALFLQLLPENPAVLTRRADDQNAHG